MATILLLLWFVLLSTEKSVQQEQARICHRVYSNYAHISVEQGVQQPQENIDKTSEVCNSGNHQACYTLWKETKTASNTTEIVIIAQGCWESSGKEDCNSPVCVANRRPSKAMNDTKFCCCSGDLCNYNVSVGYDSSEIDYGMASRIVTSEEQTKAASRSSLRDTIVIIVSCLVTLTIGLVGSFALYKNCRSPNKPQMLDSVRLVENIQNERPLKMIELVGQGRYGSLWKGMDKDGKLVAVKMFPPHYRQLYCNERDIYSLPFMDNSAIVTYYGCQESPGQLQLLLLYCSLGCLQDYLKVQTVDSTTFCRMALSIAKGLAHLHTEIRHGDKLKPCVCHRDLNTRNILVKSDLSCCLCDLGLAIQIADSHHCRNEEATIKSVSDVGTLRYMAPEVLEGAVNLRDCESSLKQIDVYALGLVLWELATRCSDFYIGSTSAASYAMPFEAEIGQHPTFEQMQVMVSRNKARPLFPPLWRDCPAVRSVRETIEDCWDQDAEARLTALCVVERLSDLTQLCQRESQGCYPYSLGAQIISFNNATGDNSAPEEMVESTVSEGTVETLLTMSPSEPIAPTYTWKDSNNRAAANAAVNVAITIQPYQGRNPCLERNLLMWGDAQEEDVSPLVDRSMKHQVVREDQQPCSLQPAASNIPYVHNRVPKQCNVPPSTQLPGFIRKLLHKKLNLPSASEDHHLLSNGANNDIKMTVSPFEKHNTAEDIQPSASGRPTSLPLELGSVFLDAKSGRIKHVPDFFRMLASEGDRITDFIPGVISISIISDC
ncbi:kinase protein wishful thinking isoform X2 [Lycorma delicatula]|uniref:kinase protein wishful thinking isoform X2 n=1 Tax=Lycorma delicatula TaxID=130591 RepID=UPI003F51A1C8